jgi:hypothetical protein
MNRAPAHELSRTGVGLIGGTRFVPLDNGFPTVEDVAAVQGICDGLDEGPITEGLSHLPELKEIGFTASRRRPPVAAHPWPHPPHPARLPLPGHRSRHPSGPVPHPADPAVPDPQPRRADDPSLPVPAGCGHPPATAKPSWTTSPTRQDWLPATASNRNDRHRQI